MKTARELKDILNQIDHKSYGAYKSIAGAYSFRDYVLSIDHVQGDPFATPSRARLLIDSNVNHIPEKYFDTPEKRVALEDCLLRGFNQNIYRLSHRVGGSGNSGKLQCCQTGQAVLERIAVLITPKQLEVRFEIGLPARGRTILAKELEEILFGFLPDIAKQSFFFENLSERELDRVADLAVDQAYIRGELDKMGLVAFIANGAILPRESGVSDKPLKGAVPFKSPKELEVTLELPNAGTVQGMGIRRGITLIVGGGYHGKSTMLRAIETGVYNHIAGDGREYVITQESALKIRAEDGRSIKSTDISQFISNLPNKQDTRRFSTENASGSTSQAANIIEGIESRTELLLIDEDTSATNFMIRDALMNRLVSENKEPITPFIKKVRGLYEDLGISTIIVVGSSGSYLSVADTVIQLDNYEARDVTQKAREVCQVYGEGGEIEKLPFTGISFQRVAMRGKPSERGNKIKTIGTDTVSINKEAIDLRYLEQVVDSGQMKALGYLIDYAMNHIIDGKKTVQDVVAELWKIKETKGFVSLIPKNYSAGSPVLPRIQEIFGALNRYRSLKIK